VTKFNKTCSSPEVEKEIFFLNHKVREIYMECFISLVYKYQVVAFRRNWSQLNEGTPGTASEESFEAMGSVLRWLCAVANDVCHIDDEFHYGTINEIALANIESEMESGQSIIVLDRMTQHFTNVNSFSKEFSRQSGTVSHTILEFITTIFFNSFEELIPTKEDQIYKSWSDDDDHEGGGLVQRIVVEIIWNLNERFDDLELHCSLHLLFLCFRKFKVWYLKLLLECSSSSSLSDSDFDHIHTDCSFVVKEFTTLLEKYSDIDSSSLSAPKEIKFKEFVERMVGAFAYIKVLLSARFDSVELQEVTDALYDEAVREPLVAPGILAFIENMMSMRGKTSRRRASVSGTEARAAYLEFNCKRFTDLQDTNSNTKSDFNSDSLLCPCAEYVVFDLRVDLGKYLFGGPSTPMTR